MSHAMKTPSRQIESAKKAFEKKLWFEAERSALQIVEHARGVFDFDSMAAALPILRDARMARFEEAFQIADGTIRELEEPIEEDFKVTPGCWLVQPPFVGADARNIRSMAIEQELPVAVLCREPLTQLGFQPVVSIGRITIRTKVDPPENPSNLDLEWFKYALDELGEAAIESIDTGTDVVKQVDALLDCIATIPEHARLHDALEETCRLAADAMRNQD